MKNKESNKTTNSRRRYDEEFKSSVIQMMENGQSIAEVSQAMGIGESLLYRWKAALKTSDSVEVDEEKEALRRRVKQLELERDILKKALAIFSRAT
jgi:transposase